MNSANTSGVDQMNFNEVSDRHTRWTAHKICMECQALSKVEGGLMAGSETIRALK